MLSAIGDPTLLTARVAMLLYAASLGLRLLRPDRPSAARAVYTAGAAILLVHIAVAFHTHHNWSHAAAQAHVGQRTAEVTGVASGAGLWLNYLFAVVWLGDVTIWWLTGHPRYLSRRPWIPAFVHAFLLFMAVNASIVFAHGAARVASAAVLLLLAILYAGTFRAARAGPVGVNSV